MRASDFPSRPEPRGGRRAAQKAATRKALCEAGRARFLTSGYSAARIEDIAADAGASTATFYLHFPTKRDLVLELATEVEQETAARYPLLTGVVAARSRETIVDWLTGTFEAWPVMAPLVRVVEQAQVVDSMVGAASLDVHAIGVRAVVEGLITNPRVSVEEAHMRASLVISLHHGVFRDYQRAAVADLSETVPVLSAMWYSGLYGED